MRDLTSIATYEWFLDVILPITPFLANFVINIRILRDPNHVQKSKFIWQMIRSGMMRSNYDPDYHEYPYRYPAELVAKLGKRGAALSGIALIIITAALIMLKLQSL